MISYFILSYVIMSIVETQGFSKSTDRGLKTSVVFHRINTLRKLQSENPLNNRKFQYFQLKKLSNSSKVRCNDGSIPGYYTRPSKLSCSKKWLIFLEGGWYCFDNNTCELRRRTHYDLFSSEFWSSERQLGGILSNNERINPNFHDYNAVYIPYCSSDLWSGKQWEKTNGWYFHGSRILNNVIDDLTNSQPFKSAHEVVFVGSSAGGIGVLLNIDRLARRINRKLRRNILINGIVDSAWFLDYPAFRESNCTHIYDCPPESAVKKGMSLWNPRIPKRCKNSQGRGREWRCFMGPVIYKHLRNPVFIIQSLFDDAQLQMSKVPILEGGSSKKFSYVQQLGRFAAQTLREAKGVFAHSCVDHEILTKSNWAYVSINNQYLHVTLNYWAVHLERSKKNRRRNNKNNRVNRLICKNTKKPKLLNANPDPSKYKIIDSCQITQETNYTIQIPGNRTSSKCMDTIPLIPFCNPTCSPLSHPTSGLKMSFIDLLELYNVKINLIAKSLDVKMENLRKMNTQQQISLLYCSSQ